MYFPPRTHPLGFGCQPVLFAFGPVCVQVFSPSVLQSYSPSLSEGDLSLVVQWMTELLMGDDLVNLWIEMVHFNLPTLVDLSLSPPQSFN